jgi:adenosylhomocysteine nucleosidase
MCLILFSIVLQCITFLPNSVGYVPSSEDFGEFLKLKDISMIYILVSFKREIDRFLDGLSKIEQERRAGFRIYRGSYSGKDLCIVKTGIGKGRLTPPFFEDADLIVSTGFCGSLSPSVKAGDIVVSQELVFVSRDVVNLLVQGGDGEGIKNKLQVERTHGGEEIVKKIDEPVLQRNISVHFGRTVTSSRVIAKPEEKLLLGNTLDALSVDMEDFYRFEMAKKSGADFISVRAAFDEVDDEIPVFPVNVSIRKLSATLQKRLKRAQEGISFALERVLE